MNTHSLNPIFILFQKNTWFIEWLPWCAIEGQSLEIIFTSMIHFFCYLCKVSSPNKQTLDMTIPQKKIVTLHDYVLVSCNTKTRYGQWCSCANSSSYYIWKVRMSVRIRMYLKLKAQMPRHNAYMACLIWVSVEWDGAIDSI